MAGIVIGVTIRRRQWRRICFGFSKPGSSGVNLVERIEKVEEDLRNSATVIWVLSRQLEKLRIRFRVTRKSMKEPIAQIRFKVEKREKDMKLKMVFNENLLQLNAYEFLLFSTLYNIPRIMGGYDPCLDDYVKSYYNKPEVQKGLHVGDGNQLKNWSICNMDVFYGWAQSKVSVLPIYKKLIDAKLRIWVYSGDIDGRVPVLSTRYNLSSLGLPITRAWRPWYHQKQAHSCNNLLQVNHNLIIVKMIL